MNRQSSLADNEYFTNVYINNIDSSVDEAILRDICETFGGRVVSLVIIRENGTSLGYGFCNFATHEEAVRAIENMNNLFIVNKKIAVSRATTKAERAKFLRSVHFPLESPEKNPNVYVKNLDYSIEEETLRKYFRPFGTIINVRIMRDDIGNSKGFGFVSFSEYTDARKAVAAMDGVRIGKLAIHVDFYEAKEGKAASAPATPVAGPSTLPRNLKLPLPSKKPSPLVIPSDRAVGSPKLCLPSKMGSPVVREEGDDDKITGVQDRKDKGKDDKSSEKKKRRRKRKRRAQKKSKSGEKESNSTTPSSADPPIDHIGCDEDTDVEEEKEDDDDDVDGEEVNDEKREDEKTVYMLRAERQRQLEESKTIIVRGLRYNYTEKDVRRFFYDVNVADVRPVTNSRGFFSGEWLVNFPTVKDANTALRICNDIGQFSAWSRKVHAEKSLIPFSSQQPSIHDLIRTVPSLSSEVSSLSSTSTSLLHSDKKSDDDEIDDIDFNSIYNNILFENETEEDVLNENSIERSTNVEGISSVPIDFSNFSLFSSSWFCDEDFTSVI